MHRVVENLVWQIKDDSPNLPNFSPAKLPTTTVSRFYNLMHVCIRIRILLTWTGMLLFLVPHEGGGLKALSSTYTSKPCMQRNFLGDCMHQHTPTHTHTHTQYTLYSYTSHAYILAHTCPLTYIHYMLTHKTYTCTYICYTYTLV